MLICLAVAGSNPVWRGLLRVLWLPHDFGIWSCATGVEVTNGTLR
jgi:hypothetical protein